MVNPDGLRTGKKAVFSIQCVSSQGETIFTVLICLEDYYICCNATADPITMYFLLPTARQHPRLFTILLTMYIVCVCVCVCVCVREECLSVTQSVSMLQ